MQTSLKRTIARPLKEDLNTKSILLTGPRQVGKTTLSQSLYPKFDYFNYDSRLDRDRLRAEAWDRKSDLIIFDEIHKMRNWKRWLKGVIDTKDPELRLLVTGSARLDISKKMGDSLAGRYFQYQLFPVDIKEAHQQFKISHPESFERLMRVGGFPEPFFNGTDRFYGKFSVRIFLISQLRALFEALNI
jgi:uncharacterized protein